MQTKSVTLARVTLPLDRYPHIDFSVTPVVVTCVMCGKTISTRAKTCSPNCRKRMSRRKEAIAREVMAVRDALANLQRYGDRWPDLQADIESALDECENAVSVTRAVVTP